MSPQTWQRHKARQAEKAQREKDADLKHEEELLGEIMGAKAAMMDKLCAIRGSLRCSALMCTDRCVHFEDGKVWHTGPVGDRWWGQRLPRCKLWAR